MLTIICLATLGAWTICVAMHGVSFPESCRIDPEAFLCLIWNSESASRRSAWVCQCRVVWHPKARLCHKWNVLLASRKQASVCQHGVVWRRGSFWLNLEFEVGVATTCVGTLSVGFKVSRVAFQGSSTLDMEYLVGVVTVGVSLPPSCHMASRGLSWLNLECCVGVVTLRR
jgi:hypothetical protein